MRAMTATLCVFFNSLLYGLCDIFFVKREEVEMFCVGEISISICVMRWGSSKNKV